MNTVDLHQHLRSALRPPSLDVIPFVNVMALVFFYYLISPVFARPAPLDIRLPRAVTSEAVREDNLMVLLTGENVLFFNDKVLTLRDLGLVLSQPNNQGRPLLVKVDRRASMGRIVAVLDLARVMGVERVNVVTDQEE